VVPEIEQLVHQELLAEVLTQPSLPTKLPDKSHSHMLTAIQMALAKHTRSSWKYFQLALDSNMEKY